VYLTSESKESLLHKYTGLKIVYITVYLETSFLVILLIIFTIIIVLTKKM